MSKTSSRPIILGLTGSIGMGKSAVAAMFQGLGVPVFDADAAVHQLQGPGGELLAAIEAEFSGTTGSAGVDRARLGAEVFGKPEALARLEAIVHPAVAAMRAAFLQRHASAQVERDDGLGPLDEGRVDHLAVDRERADPGARGLRGGGNDALR